MIKFEEINPETCCWGSLCAEAIDAGQKEEFVLFFKEYLARCIQRDKKTHFEGIMAIRARDDAESLKQEGRMRYNKKMSRGCL
jgi:hypothetical protein